MNASFITAELAIRSALVLAIASALPGGLARSQEHRGHGSQAAAAAQPSGPESPKASGWTKLPALVPAGRGERGSVTLAPLNSNTPDLSVFSPDIAKPATTFAKSGGKWTIKQPDPNAGGYSLLLAKEVSPTEIRTASTLWMFPSKPQSPEPMLNMKRSGLVIFPMRLPQFGGFREGKPGEFVIRYEGVPVPGVGLTFDTENGSHETLVADGNGIVSVSFPRDFDPSTIEKEGGAARTRRSFVLGAELERDGVRHVTGFSSQYLPDLMRERNLLAGTGLFVFGMILATPMLRRKKESSNA